MNEIIRKGTASLTGRIGAVGTSKRVTDVKTGRVVNEINTDLGFTNTGNRPVWNFNLLMSEKIEGNPRRIGQSLRSVRCIAFDDTAIDLYAAYKAGDFKIGQEVSVSGRLQDSLYERPDGSGTTVREELVVAEVDLDAEALETPVDSMSVSSAELAEVLN